MISYLRMTYLLHQALDEKIERLLGILDEWVTKKMNYHHTCNTTNATP